MTSLPFKAPRSRGWLYAVVALLIFSLVYISLPGLFQELEYRLYDYRLRLSSRPEPAKEIVMIDIDDESSKALASEGSWPWNRGVHAKVVDVLTQCNVGLVVFDILFRGHGSGPKEGNVSFSQALAQNGNVVLAVAVQLAREEELIRMELDEEDRALRSSFLDLKGPRITKLFQAEGSRAPLSVFSKSARGVGHIAALCDSDGVFRRLPLIIGFNGNILPSIDLLATLKYLQPDKVEWLKGKSLRLDGVTYPDGRKGTITIPVDDKGCMLINYSGTWGQAFDHISLREIYESYGNPAKIEQFREMLNQKVVIISLAMSGSTDMGPIPIETATPLSTVHSNAINTILTGAFLKEAPVAVQIFIGSLMIIIIILVSLRLSPLYFCISSLFLILAYISSNFFLFS
ncbi:MAG: CHASE2 domain-containing protein, partial [Deltaproteobacteria bacterium]|nr:CHASE2 domain-containing protein [Deltaproteobacteria bacterium]